MAMRRGSKGKRYGSGSPAFSDPAVAEVFNAYADDVKGRLLALRTLIFETAVTTKGVGEVEEALRWGQPSYLTTQSGSGSTIRIDQVKGEVGRYAMYVNCRTSLVPMFRELYPNELEYGGNRSVLFGASSSVPADALKHCISLALTYHARKERLSISRSSVLPLEENPET